MAMRLFKRYSLKWRLTLVFTFGMVFLLFFLSILIYWGTSNLVYNHERHLLSQKATAITSDLQAELTEESVLRSDYLSRLLTNYTDQNQLILVNDRHGRQVVSVKGVRWDEHLNKAPDKILTVTKSIAPASSSVTTFTVQIKENTEQLDWYLTILSTTLLLSSLIAVILSATGGYMLSNWGLKPLDQLIGQIHDISPKRPSQRIHHYNVEYEIYELIEAFNLLLDRMEEALLSQQQFVADASHELRTPLFIIEGYVKLLQNWGSHKSEIREEALSALKQESARLFQLIEDMLFLAKQQDESHPVSEKSVQPLAPLLQEIKRAWTPVYPKEIALSFAWEDALCLSMNREKMRQLLDILLDNARKYTEQGQVAVHAYSEDGWIHIIVEDTGVGIPARELPHIFKRFYRVEKSRNRKKGGSGLGLSIAQSIVEEHRGQIGIGPSEAGGIRVHVRFQQALDRKKSCN